ncbi:hypothetical protein PPACK8108_LOCUS19508 [Phakopsora pachyrhizi]|uniref:RNA polymerase II assembly factor Rtp1 C-terminal domain-containing protein n=1 Tax=Phakopsora pachyrhizi TaxID=170000 RepID=A0AAV0BG79_PHAPC|nr:hypothetical protein PPACK8108_LOCUS19508 [Phakopsora pachyrhizi]
MLPEYCIKWASVMDKDPIQLEISKSLTHERAPTYIQNPDQLQLLTGPNLEESWESCSDEDNHKGKLNESNLIVVTDATLPFIMPYEDEVDEFNDWRSNLSNLRGGHQDNHGENNNEMIKEDIEQESLPGSWLGSIHVYQSKPRESSSLESSGLGSTERFSKINRIVTNVIVLILKMIKEEDSLVYLNSIKALCKLAEKYPEEICDWLNLIYESLKDQSGDREKAASKLEIIMAMMSSTMTILCSCGNLGLYHEAVPEQADGKLDIIQFIRLFGIALLVLVLIILGIEIWECVIPSPRDQTSDEADHEPEPRELQDRPQKVWKYIKKDC